MPTFAQCNIFFSIWDFGMKLDIIKPEPFIAKNSKSTSIEIFLVSQKYKNGITGI